MPWIVNQSPAFLTTHASYDASNSYYGTIVHGCTSAAGCTWTPYISTISHSCSCASETVTVTTTITGTSASVVASNQGEPLFGGANQTAFDDTYLSTTWLSSNVGEACEDPSFIWYWLREERLCKSVIKNCQFYPTSKLKAML